MKLFLKNFIKNNRSELKIAFYPIVALAVIVFLWITSGLIDRAITTRAESLVNAHLASKIHELEKQKFLEIQQIRKSSNDAFNDLLTRARTQEFCAKKDD